MNNADRKQLRLAIAKLTEAKEIIDQLQNSELEKFENLSENLQSSDRGTDLEENAGFLEDISLDIEACIDNCEGLI